MSNHKLHLLIISQEKQLADVEVDSLSVPTMEGEITILPSHVALFSRLQTGELRYTMNHEEMSFVISKGFVDVGMNNDVTVLVDIAVEARQISLEKAEAAVKAAHETMSQTIDRRELMMAEASLRLALLEIKVAQKTKHARI